MNNTIYVSILYIGILIIYIFNEPKYVILKNLK
jgi:hypothetical protein